MNCDKKTYQTIIVGLDMMPRYVGDYTMDQIYDFIKYAKGVNPTTTATISEFGNTAVIVHKIDSYCSYCAEIKKEKRDV